MHRKIDVDDNHRVYQKYENNVWVAEYKPKFYRIFPLNLFGFWRSFEEERVFRDDMGITIRVTVEQVFKSEKDAIDYIENKKRNTNGDTL